MHPADQKRIAELEQLPTIKALFRFLSTTLVIPFDITKAILLPHYRSTHRGITPRERTDKIRVDLRLLAAAGLLHSHTWPALPQLLVGAEPNFAERLCEEAPWIDACERLSRRIQARLTIAQTRPTVTYWPPNRIWGGELDVPSGFGERWEVVSDRARGGVVWPVPDADWYNSTNILDEVPRWIAALSLAQLLYRCYGATPPSVTWRIEDGTCVAVINGIVTRVGINETAARLINWLHAYQGVAPTAIW